MVVVFVTYSIHRAMCQMTYLYDPSYILPFFKSWDQVIEVKYSLTLGDPVKIQPTDDEAVKDLREVPGNWDIECDEEMVKFLSEHVVQENEKLGNVKQYVEAVAVSSSWVSSCPL